MSFAGKLLSVSLVTVSFEVAGSKTRMTFNEQVAMLAGGKAARDQRLEGTEQGLDRFVEVVESMRARDGSLSVGAA
jgi:hypothetical protein